MDCFCDEYFTYCKKKVYICGFCKDGEREKTKEIYKSAIEKADYQKYEGAAYCEGPLLFPAPLNQTICITIDIDYTGTLKSKTFTLKNITLERNKMYLFTLWILNENIDISISPDAELNLEELKFNSQVAGNDGFWN